MKYVNQRQAKQGMMTNIVKISLNLSRTVVKFRLKNVPFQVIFCKLKVLLLFIQKALLIDVFTL